MKMLAHASRSRLRLRPCLLLRIAVLPCLLGLSLGVQAAGGRDMTHLRPIVLGWFEGSDTVEAPAGTPPAAPVKSAGKTIGYVFFTSDIAPLPAYSGKPIDVMVGLDRKGAIAGVQIIQHEEPILVVGITEDDLAKYVGQYEHLRADTPIKVGGRERPGYQRVDGISGATITVMVMNNTITRAASGVAQAYGLNIDSQEATPIERGIAAGQAAAAPGAANARAPDAEDTGFVSGDPRSARPMWQGVWEEQSWRLAGLALGLLFLTTVLMLQDWLTRYPGMLGRLRGAFLVYTLVFVGWYGLAQLSVVNVLTFLHSLTGNFSWDTFLIEPMTFVLWSFVAMTLLLWGRGVYCGWLCPFGALQELVNRVAQRLKVRQFLVPELVHERLLAIKYLILIVLFGLSLQSMTDAIRISEVEPFKTAITLRFQREAPYVTYAVVLVLLSAFNGKLFCKYLCPLGAALAMGSHFRIFDWLHRRRECGRPCQTCASECPSQAIRPTGEINAHECHYCLDCQVTFWNTHKCPPLVERRKKFERRGQPVKLTLK